MDKLILDNIIFSLQKVGGISVVWMEILNKILSENNIEYECLEWADSKDNLFRKAIDIPEANLRIQKRKLFLSRYFSPRVQIDRPIIFHSSYYRTISNKFVKNITTVHDFTYEVMYGGIRRKIHSWQKFKAINNSDIIVCISQNTAHDLLKLCPNIDRKKIRIIYNGVSEQYYPLEQMDESYKSSVLFVGARSGYKNFKFTVDSIVETKYNLVICGSPLLDSEVQYLNNKLGISRYKYLGRVSNEELNRLYNSVMCLAYPSSYEGFGIPVLEAQRAKCPVIALNTSSVPEVMGAKSFLMDKLTTSEFKSRLESLENEKIRYELIEHGYNFSKQFSWDKMSDDYINIYKEISLD